MAAINFKPPGPVSRSYMLSSAFVRNIRGPVGSAKSSTSLMELFRQWQNQEPTVDGRSNKCRLTRTAIIRNTSPMLKTTTMKTYAEWFDETVFGTPKMAPPPFEHEIDLSLADGTRMVAEVLFLALDRPEDVRKLLSLELTWAFINEARETGKQIVDGVTQRLRRFPSQRMGGITRSGLLMDTNPPDEDHWWAIMSGDCPPPEWMSEDDKRQLVRPPDWEFFTQPDAVLEVRGPQGNITGYEVNPEAENLANLDPNYYPGQISGKTKAYIDVYLRNRYGSTADGRPVHPEYADAVHKAKDPIEPVPLVPFILGIDFGLTPAAVFLQRIRNRWICFREIALDNASAKDLARAINTVMKLEYPEHKIMVAYGDPAGSQQVGTDKNTPFRVMRAHGIPCRPAMENNDPEIRRAAGQAVLTRIEEGHPAMLISPACKVLNAGLGGSWCFRRVRAMEGGNEFKDAPQKNKFSHTGEAWEYALVGAGEARDHMLNKQRSDAAKRQVDHRPPRDPLARLRRPSITNRRGW